MSDGKHKGSPHQRWAHFRFAVVGELLARPPLRGDLTKRLEELASRQWTHPITGEPARFEFSTVERWYYLAKQAGTDPVGALRRKVRKDSGGHVLINTELRAALEAQYAAHPSWSIQLHYDNLRVVLGDKVPSYSTVRRYMRAVDMHRRPRLEGLTAAQVAAIRRREERETSSYEHTHVGGLWHLDFHHSPLPVLCRDGEWRCPLCLGILDDHSRLVCHIQWFLSDGERTDDLVHGFSQAVLKRGLPRAQMTDNGSPMTAAEFVEGLRRLSITHEPTLEHSPNQNGKQEHFWTRIDERLMPMLENVKDLTLAQLNEATQAFVEMEYHREQHGETGETPLHRFLHGPSVMRPPCSTEELRRAFCMQRSRTVRQSDLTVSIEGVRFELPHHYRALSHVTVRYARWDLSGAYLVDEKSDAVLARLFPLDKSRNASGLRRPFHAARAHAPTEKTSEPAPLLKQLMADYAARGLAPAYIAKPGIDEEE